MFIICPYKKREREREKRREREKEKGKYFVWMLTRSCQRKAEMIRPNPSTQDPREDNATL